MKWVALTILVVLVPYTFITLHYRKQGKAFEPHHDIKERANTLRLLSAGFQRVTLEAERPEQPLAIENAATVLSGLGGLPSALGNSLVDKPLLPSEIVAVTAAAEANTLLSYPIEFRCALPDNKQQLGGAALYLREGEIFIVSDFERLTGGLLARTRENVIRLTVPPGVLKAGSYRVTLLGSRTSKAYDLVVK